MKLKWKQMFEWTRWHVWVGFGFQPYTYDGNDGRRVIDWMLYLGFIQLTKYKIAKQGNP